MAIPVQLPPIPIFLCVIKHQEWSNPIHKLTTNEEDLPQTQGGRNYLISAMFTITHPSESLCCTFLFSPPGESLGRKKTLFTRPQEATGRPTLPTSARLKFLYSKILVRVTGTGTAGVKWGYLLPTPSLFVFSIPSPLGTMKKEETSIWTPSMNKLSRRRVVNIKIKPLGVKFRHGEEITTWLLKKCVELPTFRLFRWMKILLA